MAKGRAEPLFMWRGGETPDGRLDWGCNFAVETDRQKRVGVLMAALRGPLFLWVRNLS
jgi:hypothetical protein